MLSPWVPLRFIRATLLGFLLAKAVSKLSPHKLLFFDVAEALFFLATKFYLVMPISQALLDKTSEAELGSEEKQIFLQPWKHVIFYRLEHE
jgi:hypothetical protein